jgi:hypothetical protein
MKPAVVVTSVLCVVAIGLGVLAGSQLKASSQQPLPAPAPALTDGIAPYAVLPSQAQPLRAVASGSSLIVLAQVPGETKLTLFTVASDGAISATPLPIEGGGLWAGLARSDDGSVWVGALSTVLQISPNGVQRQFALSSPSHLLPAPYAGPSSAQGPIENGQITSLGVIGGRVFVGRAGSPALTALDAASGTVSIIPLPDGVGDIADISAGASGQLAFTVNHSARTAGQLNDELGSVDALGQVRVTARPARSVAGNGRRLAVAALDLIVEDPAGLVAATQVTGASYDLSRVALRADDTAVVRVGGDHALAFIGQGIELRRASYQVPIGQGRDGKPQAYIARLAFLIPMQDGVYFALQGLPNVYRTN